MVSLRLVGGGTSDTNEEIELKGLLLIKSYLKIAALDIIRFNPTYHLYKNNCQNFAKFLVEAICNTHVSLETIQDVLESLYNPKDMAPPPAYFPGSYPPSISMRTRSEFFTAGSTFFQTAEETSFHTAPAELGCSETDYNPDDRGTINDIPIDNGVTSEMSMSCIDVELSLW